MTIYIEQSLLENFVIDFLLLKLSLLLFKYKSKKYKIIIASLIGALISLISPLLAPVFSFVLKIFLGLLMVIIASPKISFKKIFYLYLSFIGFTFVFGGASYAFINTTNFNSNFNFTIPSFYILLTCVITSYFIILIINKIYSRKVSESFEYTVTLFSENTSITTLAFLDTGNRLSENLSPVILIDALTFLKLYPKESLTNVLLKKTANLSMKNTHILKVCNINNSNSNLIVFTLPKIKIENIKEIDNVLCAISLKKFSTEQTVSCLLNPMLL